LYSLFICNLFGRRSEALLRRKKPSDATVRNLSCIKIQKILFSGENAIDTGRWRYPTITAEVSITPSMAFHKEKVKRMNIYVTHVILAGREAVPLHNKMQKKL
jgi:hypothetical protein